ncbi:MAG: 30S ribosomal protein S6 [Bacteroidales bacterium]|jgi:small subunit ribosomal protein S6|nr:30S ribosomal protein S6 [Bacteroidales bacterium]
MVNQYETVFIATPVLSEAQMKEAVEKYRGYLNELGAEIVQEESWGLRKLAYPIQKKSTGFYHIFEYKANPELIRNLETYFRRDERILRFLTMKMDKYAVAYADKKRSRTENKEN